MSDRRSPVYVPPEGERRDPGALIAEWRLAKSLAEQRRALESAPSKPTPENRS